MESSCFILDSHILHHFDTNFNVEIQKNLNFYIDKQINMYYHIEYKETCNIYKRLSARVYI